MTLEKYRDPSLPIAERVASLLSLMTPDEKIAQLAGIWSRAIVEDETFMADRAAMVCPNGIGHLTRHANLLAPEVSARLQNEVQKHFVENTRLGIPVIVHEESASGYVAKDATQFPMPIGLAASFDTDLMKRIGDVIRRQMMAVGARHTLAPLADIARDHRWGRVEETFGEDTHLVSRMAVAYVRGVQGDDLTKGVVCTGKHFVGYGASQGGLNWAPSHILPRQLMDVYLPPFAAMITEAKVESIMNSYQEQDGVPCGADPHLMRDILRGELGFTGNVVTDYFTLPTMHSYHNIAATDEDAAVLGIKAGLDVELPMFDIYGDPLKSALAKGRVTIEEIDEAVGRVLTQKFKQGLFENPYVDLDGIKAAFDTAEDRKLAREAAAKTVVLLKNDGNVLPLTSATRKIALIGPHAHSARLFQGDYNFPAHHDFQYGEMADGALGSGRDAPLAKIDANATTALSAAPGMMGMNQQTIDLADYLPATVTILDGLQMVAPEGTQIVHAVGCGVTGTDESQIPEAVAAAQSADVVILCLGEKSGLAPGNTTGEANDRATLSLSGVQQKLLDAVSATGKPVVLIMVTGRPLALTSVNEKVAAILYAWLPGEEGGSGIADVLYGVTCPSARLPISLVHDQGQMPFTYARKPSEGRSQFWGPYSDMPNTALYPFGHGLTYTSFTYSDAKLEAEAVDSHGVLTAKVTITNSGERHGVETIQLYLRDMHGSVTRPVKELKSYAQLSLEQGASATVTFEVPMDQCAFTGFDNRFKVEPGHMEIMIGASSEDIRWSTYWKITGEERIVSRLNQRPVNVRIN